eukprot:5693649-Pleurochrysis_carterae.AAC.4
MCAALPQARNGQGANKGRSGGTGPEGEKGARERASKTGTKRGGGRKEQVGERASETGARERDRGRREKEGGVRGKVREAGRKEHVRERRDRKGCWNCCKRHI